MNLVRIAGSDQERRAIGRLRYNVYIQEQGKAYAANHHRRELTDSADRTAVHYYVGDDRGIIGAMRSAFDYPSSEQIRGFSAHNRPLLAEEPIHSSSRLCLAPVARGTTTAWLLAKAAYLHARSSGITISYLHCAPALVRMYERFGYERYRKQFLDPVVGPQVPLRLVADDQERLQAIESLFGPLAAAFADRLAWRALIAQTFHSSALPLPTFTVTEGLR